MALGSIRIPFTFSNAGYIDTTTNVGEQIEMGLRAAIGTRLGERFMAGQVGSRVPDLIFDPLGVSFETTPDAYIQQEATKAVLGAYPGVTITSVLVTESTAELGAYDVLVNYLVGGNDASLTAAVTVAHDLLKGK